MSLSSIASTLAAAAAAAAIGAPSFAQTAEPAPGAATPQAALDQGALAVLMPSGRKLFAKDMIMQTLMFLAFVNPDEPMPGGPKAPPETWPGEGGADRRRGVEKHFPIGATISRRSPVEPRSPPTSRGSSGRCTTASSTTRAR